MERSKLYSNIFTLSNPDIFTIEYNNIITEIAFDINPNSNITKLFTLNTAISSVEPLKIIYVLPVQSLSATTFGNGIDEIKTILDAGDFGNNILFIQPDFNDLPWVANHPTDPLIQQESNMIELFETINTQYSDYEIETYLLGFSKSGYGAMNLLLNYPEYINTVFIWDSPLSINTFVYANMADIFGTEEYLASNYDLIDLLDLEYTGIENKGIIIGGYATHTASSINFTDRMDFHSINHVEDATMTYSHDWNYLWIKDLFSYHKAIII